MLKIKRKKKHHRKCNKANKINKKENAYERQQQAAI